MIQTIASLALCAALAALGSLGGARWLARLYVSDREALSFPARAEAQTRRHAALLFAALLLMFSWTALTMQHLEPRSFAFLLVFQFFLILYTVTDLEQQVIFDRMLAPFALIGLLSLPLLGRVASDHLLAALAGGGVFLALAIATRGGIGGGDIKLIAALGLWLGTDQLLTVGCTGMILGGLAALLLLVTKRRQRGEMFAYGPYFTVAALVLTLV
ncbi:A24 family peptidase [uncultured Selenomonas sp.]|uniref:prepilin peptidase n=1 Tax=uncultured Selenomonas sp. TaxID=159275 RepID=UPI00258CFDBD|nr:A24 family peptidase [uncultured Selenomonas sp.]